MPPKSRRGNGKAKSHVFPTKTSNKAKSSKTAAKSKSETTVLVEPPNKKVRTEAPASETKSSASLLDLPPEIRLIIYRYVIDMQGTSVLRIHRGMMKQRGSSTRIQPKRGSHKPRYLIKCCGNTNFETTYVASNGYCPHHQSIEWSLMWICSVVRKEVMPMMFEKRRIYAIGLNALCYFLKDLTPDQRASVRHLDVGHCCDQVIYPKTHAVWKDTFRYIAKNLQLKSLSVEARSGETEYDDMIWVPSDRNFSWVYEICKMRNLEKVDIEIMVYEPDVGFENWADFVNEMDDIELDEDGEPKYDPSFDWIPSEISEDITWRVAQKVLTPAAWKTMQDKRFSCWHSLCEMRDDVFSDMMEEDYELDDEFIKSSWGIWPHYFETYIPDDDEDDDRLCKLDTCWNF